MKHLLLRTAQRLLALSFLSASLVVAQTAPKIVAARKQAAEIMPQLQTGDWHSCEAALQTIKQLSDSQEQVDKKLADQLMTLSGPVIEKGLKDLPSPPEQEKLLTQAHSLVHWLLRHPIPSNRQSARSIIDLWEKALPEDLRVPVLRLDLHVEEKNRAEQIKLAAVLKDEMDLDQNIRDWARMVYVSALLRGKPSADDIKHAEAVVLPWLEKQPDNIEARLKLVEIHHARPDWPAQYALATELLTDEKLTGNDRKWMHHRRLEGALNTGKTHELNEQDWNYMLEQITGGKKLKKFIDEHGQLLLGIAFGIGWLWLLIVAWITRSMRSGPPGFWMVALWSTVILYASTVVMISQVLCVTFSLLGILLLIFATTGSRAPLGYLVSPQAATESGKARWAAILGWCVLAFLIIEAFNFSYAWAFERVMGRKLEAQLVARLLQADSLPRLAAMVLAGGIFVPFLEEVIFRGVLQDWVARYLPPGWCVAVVSVIFGVVHGLEMAIPITFIGVALSLLRLRYRSLLPCILLHSLNNSIMIILLYVVPDIAL